ncbi:MAG: circularly permuted type 2 ATP-grasp protein [Minwuia sp.]|nr:circularly permuted type 2 ATP-grasp protein [Minwuia sp.]
MSDSSGTGDDWLSGPLSLGYSPVPDVHDELVSADGDVRPGWQGVSSFLADLSTDEWDRRWQQGQQAMREQGVTYNVYVGGEGDPAAWRLDPVPLVVSGAEWQALASALTQRATLLDLVLRDLLGKQTLLRDGHLPPALIAGHPGYFLPCVDPETANRPHLHFYGADLARAPDGQWRVMMDRTEAPSGFGYALANRNILSRVFPELLRSAGVHPVGTFFRDMRAGLDAISPGMNTDGRTILLTPGHGNEAYFEHAFLARQLGCTLAEADDLTVRGGHVFLKTLEGLQPVDVILRRTDSAWCDPLELRGDSTLGVPGLVAAARQGNVSVVNTLGSGVVESPGLMPFLPGLCQRLLGQDLQMPSVATWWCGQAAEREQVLAQLDRMVVKPAFPADPGEPAFGRAISEAARTAIADRIRVRPDRHIGQEHVGLSTAPTWSRHGLEPRAVMLRILLCRNGSGGWSVLPGGLVRVAPDRRGRVVSMQQGGGAKDVWVLGHSKAPEAASAGDRRPVPAAAAIRRAGGNLPSRTADSLFWLGRYQQRAEAQALRLRGAIACIDERLLPVATAEETAVLHGLLVNLLPREKAATDARGMLRQAGQSAFDPDNPMGLHDSIQQLYRNADTVRERLSQDSWLAVDRVKTALQAAERVAGRRGTRQDLLLPRLDDIIYALRALGGALNDTMSRGYGWRFHDLGRSLERAQQTVELFGATMLRQGGDNALVLNALLDISDCAVTYRGRYLAEPELVPVLDLLVADLENPRSLAHQLQQLLDHVEALSRLRGPLLGEDQRLAIAAFSAVRTADIAHLSTSQPDGSWPLLERLVEYLQSHLFDLGTAVAQRYFSHVTGRGAQMAIGGVEAETEGEAEAEPDDAIAPVSIVDINGNDESTVPRDNPA